eukprot:g680.t1
MKDCKEIKSPMDSNSRPSANDQPDLKTEKGAWEAREMKKLPFRQLLGTLAHLARFTRPDIKFAVFYIARYQNNPGQKHYSALKRICRYLQGTKTEGIVFGNSKLPLTIFVDADYGGDPDRRRSTTGYCCLFYGGPGSTKSKLQPVIADSSTAAELIAISAASKEARWLSWLIKDFGCSPNYTIAQQNPKLPLDPVVIYEDNNGVRAIAKDKKVSKRCKHIAVKYFLIQEMVAEHTCIVIRCDTNKNLADIFTKALPPQKHIEMASYFFTGTSPIDVSAQIK